MNLSDDDIILASSRNESNVSSDICDCTALVTNTDAERAALNGLRTSCLYMKKEGERRTG